MKEEIILLETDISLEKDLLKKAILLSELSFTVRHANPKRSFSAAEEALKISEENNFPAGKAGAWNNLGFYFLQLADHEKSLKYLLDAAAEFEQLSDEKGLSDVQYNLGALHLRLGIFNVAIDAIQKSLNYREKTGDQRGIATCLFQLTYIHEMFGSTDEGLETAQKCLAIREEMNDKMGVAAIFMIIGSLYMKKKDFENAKLYLGKSLELRTEKDEVRGYFATLYRWTELFIEMGNYEDAKKFAKEGLEISSREEEWFGVLRFYQVNGRIAYITNNLEAAQRFYNEAIQIANDKNYKSIEFEVHEAMALLYEKLGDTKNAYESFKKFHNVKEEVLNTKNNTQLRSMLLLKEIEGAHREAEIEKNKNAELQSAYKIIEEKNKDITDSITYAGRIQRALLTHEFYFEKNLNRLSKKT